MSRIDLWQEEVIEENGFVTIGATLEFSGKNRQHLWYRVPEKHSSILTSSCDPFVIATIFTAMSRKLDLMVHGEVSPSLLRNLEEFQIIWSAWKPGVYQFVQVDAEIEREQSSGNIKSGNIKSGNIEAGNIEEERAISAFSGGVDSGFTALRHCRLEQGRRKCNLKAGLMVHGFDIPLHKQDIFERAAQKSQIMLSSLGMELIPIATNLREAITLNWEDIFGAAIVSCLSAVQNGYNKGLVPSGYSYRDTYPHGSTPYTDSLLSSQSFTIEHDGAKLDRLEKIGELQNWEEALENLRVCWQGEHLDENCGRCEKCIRTILKFRALGHELPPCFPADVTNQQIFNLRLRRGGLHSMQHLLNWTDKNPVSESWVQVLRIAVNRNRIVQSVEQSLPHPWQNRLRKLRAKLRG